MNSMNYPRAIFFDFDGVILDTESIYCKIMLKYNKKTNIKISKDYYINNFLGKSKNEISKILELKFKEIYDKEKYWNGLLAFREKYLLKHKVYVKKGFRKLLDYLKKNNYYVCIVSSNSLSFINKMLLNSNINVNNFNLIVTRENVKRVKPYSDLYEYAIKHTNIKNDEIIAIEDSEVGITAALNAQINVIHVKDISLISNKLLSRCLLSVSSLNKIVKYLKSIGGKNGNN